MLNNIAFIGGIHGVGKTTICKQICNQLNLEYLSASSVLKWQEINEDHLNKKVNDVPKTQDRLIFGLNKIVRKNKSYLLDGHYCLLGIKNEIINIPFTTFEKINPTSLNLITANIIEIKQNLEDRDSKIYDFDLLEKMQNNEISYAEELSAKLQIPLAIGTVSDSSKIYSLLEKSKI